MLTALGFFVGCSKPSEEDNSGKTDGRELDVKKIGETLQMKGVEKESR